MKIIKLYKNSRNEVPSISYEKIGGNFKTTLFSARKKPGSGLYLKVEKLKRNKHPREK